MRKMWLLAFIFIAINHLLVAQRAVPMWIEPGSLVVDYTNPASEDFASDAITLRGVFTPFIVNSVKIKFLSPNPVNLVLGLSGGITSSVSRFHDSRYEESLFSFDVNAMAVFALEKSRLTFSAGIGRTSGDYTIKSGYSKSINNTYSSFLGEYRYYSGRMQEKNFFPAWSCVVTGNLKIGPKKEFPSLGFQEFQLRQGNGAMSFNSFHGLAEINLVDQKIFGLPAAGAIPPASTTSKRVLMSLKFRSLGGKYESDLTNIMYWGLGAGLDVVVASDASSITAVSLDFDQLWAQKNSKAEGLYMNISVNAAVVAMIW